MPRKQIGIVGIGNMGTALVKGILSSKIEMAENFVIYDTNHALLAKRSKEFKIDFAQDNRKLVQDSKYILIAVKPQVIDAVLKEIGDVVDEDQIIISIVGGITIEHIKKYIKKKVSIVRVMPNTPALVGAGASVISHDGTIKQEDLTYVTNIFAAVGITIEMEEKYLDAVTGLSGSGPAYIFIIIEALSDGGVKMGLPRDVALKLAAQTVLGASKMFLETYKHPGALKDMVTSPGGTTITALHEIEKGSLRATLISAVEAATNKSKSMMI
ncbi:MAG: pyrroline-5-carboxylate reductase [Promethearchaeota archaeon]